jgi:dTDP-D-glucose 4,6-dehydratase
MQIGKKLPLHNKGLSIRTWLHANDTARAVLAIIESEKINEIYNVSSHLELENIEVCNKVANNYFGTFDENDLYDFSYQRPGQDLRYALDDSKLRSLGWTEEAKFDEEIVKITSYYKDTFIW